MGKKYQCEGCGGFGEVNENRYSELLAKSLNMKLKKDVVSSDETIECPECHADMNRFNDYDECPECKTEVMK